MFTSKTSWRRLQDMSWRCLQDMSSRRLKDQQMFAGKEGVKQTISLQVVWNIATKGCTPRVNQGPDRFPGISGNARNHGNNRKIN